MRSFFMVILYALTLHAHSQKSDILISENFKIRSEGEKMGLVKSSTGQLELAMDEAFLFLSKYSNALIKVKDDNIEVYTYFSDTLRLIHQAERKVLLSFSRVKDTYVSPFVWRDVVRINGSTFNSKDGRDPDYFLPRNYRVDSEFGLEVVDEKLIIQDRKLQGVVGITPLIDGDPASPNFGENLIVTDPVTGQQSFAYAAPTPAESASGIYDVGVHDWFVEPIYYSITPRFNGGCLTETRLYDDEHMGECQYQAFDKNKNSIVGPFIDESIIENKDLLKYFVPHFNCDSIGEFTDRELQKAHYIQFGFIRFYDGLKMGVFDWEGNIIVEPQDLYVSLECLDVGPSISINEDRITIASTFLNQSYPFDEGEKLSFVMNYPSYPRDGFYALNKTGGNGNHERYFSKNQYKDAVEVDTFLLETKSFEDYMDFSAHCVLENLGNGLILVNHQQVQRMGTVPLIDEDPNSPKFGENLIYTDSVTGRQSFVYDLLVPHADKSGVFDLKTHTWIIAPQYYFIEATEENFITHTGDSDWVVDVQTAWDLQGNVISVKEVGEDWLKR